MAISKAKKLAVGVGLGVAAATAAGYYFFGSKNAAKNRKQVERWALNLKKDVIAEAKKAKVVNERAMKKIIKEAGEAYRKVKTIDQKDLKKALTELSQNWQAVQEEAIGVSKKVATVAKKAAVNVVNTRKKVSR